MLKNTTIDVVGLSNFYYICYGNSDTHIYHQNVLRSCTKFSRCISNFPTKIENIQSIWPFF